MAALRSVSVRSFFLPPPLQFADLDLALGFSDIRNAAEIMLLTLLSLRHNFGVSAGIKLQNLLIAHAATTRNYLEAFWDDAAYLSARYALNTRYEGSEKSNSCAAHG